MLKLNKNLNVVFNYFKTLKELKTNFKRLMPMHFDIARENTVYDHLIGTN